MINARTMHRIFATDTIYLKTLAVEDNIGFQIYFHKNGLSTPYYIHAANGTTINYSIISLIH